MRLPHERAFTLIELLVVIAIIALLAAILVPSLAAAKRKADMASCKNNLRQMATSVHSYVTDHEEWLPPGPPGSVGGYTNGLRRSHRSMYTTSSPAGMGNPVQQIAYHTAQYLDLPKPDPSIRDCPMMRCMAAWKQADRVIQTQTNFVNYCLSQRSIGNSSSTPFGSGGRRPLRISDCTDVIPASKLWMLSDSDQVNDPGHTPQADLLAKPAHRDRRNIVYFDSHVDTCLVYPDASYNDVNDSRYGEAAP